MPKTLQEALAFVAEYIEGSPPRSAWHWRQDQALSRLRAFLHLSHYRVSTVPPWTALRFDRQISRRTGLCC